MVGADRIDLLNLIAEGHRLVRDKFDEVMWCTLPREQFKLAVDEVDLGYDDASGDLDIRGVVSYVKTVLVEKTDEDGTQRIQPWWKRK